VLLVGIAGASYSLTESLQAEGALPNVARLAEAAFSAPLRSIPPFLSPRIRNTIATGKTPEKHGIVSLAWPDAENRNHLFLSSDRKSHALWNIASDAGLTIGVVSSWTSYPPDNINGVMVFDHARWSPHMPQTGVIATSPSSASGLVFPTSWKERCSRSSRANRR
jgi:predicted AlkP superfamily phosphohydrolase/phosphomutase